VDEDIVQIQSNDCSTKNFLLPLVVGGPDMANTKSLLGINVHNIKTCDSSSNIVSIDKINKKNLSSYLAGLFEGDGHI
jgi:hypothetical protein